MLLNDPIAMYLDEGGKINPGFRLRAPIPQEIPPPDIGVPDVPLVGQPEVLPSRDRDRFQQAPNSNAGERDSIREDFEQVQSDPITGTLTNTTNMNMLLNDPINGIQDMNAYLYDPIWGSSNVGANLAMENTGGVIVPDGSITTGGLTVGNSTGGYSGYGGALTMYEDIPGLDVGDVPSFGNTEYIGA
jgi:hypothetical protein